MIATGTYEDDDITIELSVRTMKVGSEVKQRITIPRDEWDEMNDRERDRYLLQEIFDLNLVEWDHNEISID